MRNKLRLLTAALLALYCSAAFSLGMGELELKSNLNQRFDAEIVLTSVGELENDEILPNLASQEDFDRVGVDRNFQLINLRFKVRVREDGQHVIHVTSNRPIIEPFLNFIVEVIWPTGRILREYTVLLDPPVFGTEGVEKIDPGVSASQPQRQTSPSTRPQRRQIPAAPSVNTGRTEGVVTQEGEYGMTGPGDTLWAIAMKVRPNSQVSVQQTMLALKRANPDAFINDNINLLKAGHVLRVPDINEIRAQTTEEAIAEVKVQNEEYQDFREGGVTQMDARRTSRRDDRREVPREDGELKLIASDDSGSRSGRADARTDELESALQVAREDLDRSRRANSDMQGQLDDLQGQIETMNDIVKLKDDQLAALRAELQKMQTAETASTPVAQTSTPASSTGSLLANPMVLGALAVLLLGGIGAAVMVMLRRRRQAADEDEDEFQPMLMDDEPQLEAADDSAEETGVGFEAAGDEEEDVTQQTSDVIGEAEIYIAYGRFPQAISFLQNAIEAEPDRADIQLKLLEVYVQTEDATAFNLQFEQLKMLGDATATAEAEELQTQIPGAAESAAASMDATVVSSEPIAAIAEPDGDLDDLDGLDELDDLDSLGDDLDDDDLSFDLDDLDSETEDDTLDLSAAEDDDELSLDEAMELGDADLDLDLDAALDDMESLGDDDADGGELDLDLDDGLDLDMEDGLDTGDDDLEADLDLSDQLDLDDDADDLTSTMELDGGIEEDTSATVELDDLDVDGLDVDLDDELEDLDVGGLDDEDGLDLGDLDDDDGALDLSDLEDDDDALDLSDLEDDDGALDLSDLEDDDSTLDLSDLEDDDGALDLSDLEDDDDALDLSDLEDDDDALDLGSLDTGDDEIELDLGSLDTDNDEIELDLGDDDEFDLGDLDDDDLGELNLDEDASSKLDLARAYIEMGDNDGAKTLLEEVVNEGDSELAGEANELLAKIS